MVGMVRLLTGELDRLAMRTPSLDAVVQPASEGLNSLVLIKRPSQLHQVDVQLRELFVVGSIEIVPLAGSRRRIGDEAGRSGV